MKINSEKPILFWSIFLGLLSSALIFQSAFLPSGGKYSLIPYLTWPAVIFFFLYQNSLFSLGLVFFISLLSSVFFSLPIPLLFGLYLLSFFIISFIKNFFFYKSSFLFFVLVFLFSLFFPFLVDITSHLSFSYFSFSLFWFYFLKAFATLLLSFLLFPLFKNYLQENIRF